MRPVMCYFLQCVYIYIYAYLFRQIQYYTVICQYVCNVCVRVCIYIISCMYINMLTRLQVFLLLHIHI